MHYHPKELTTQEIEYFAQLTDVNHLQEAVQRIARKRNVNGIGHKYIRRYIKQSLKKLDWLVQEDTFVTDNPVVGKVRLHNIIAKLTPHANRYLMLGCHYDGKGYKKTTGSAISCALLLNIAHVLQKELKKISPRPWDISLMLVFFDGKEAIGSRDNILQGSYHLVRRWTRNGFINNIDMFLPIDFYETQDIHFPHMIVSTVIWYLRLRQLENLLYHKRTKYFQAIIRELPERNDHMPFHALRLPVLPLITIPKALSLKNISKKVDYTAIEQVSKVLRLFVLEYLQVSSKQKSGGNDGQVVLYPCLGLILTLLAVTSLWLA
ncbi:glutaminyl-peptide cyclotransferase [Drosophila tropicalis]|uniref:glutaminyl-peptide cyclotransferase n=1 Tax=Drosophila tropicalis TaxID=46794 RepID=UPI0035AB8ED2